MTRFFVTKMQVFRRLADFAQFLVRFVVHRSLGGAVIAVAIFGGRCPAVEPPAIQPGRAVSWAHPCYASDRPLELWLPENHDVGDRPEGERRQWPLILWFHGTNGRPTTQLIRDYTDGRDFVIVGMTYVQQGTLQYTPEVMAAETAAYRVVISDLVASPSVRVDPRQVYVGGFSKGGWMSALLVEKDRQLAGGLVLGGGVFDRPDASEERFTTALPIYVGIGALDGNLGMSYKAQHFFTAIGARVTLDVWPGLGHRYPTGDHDSVTLRQWLRGQAAAAPPDGTVGLELRDEAIEWVGDQIRAIRDIERPVDRWLAMEELAETPFAALIDDIARQSARELLDELRDFPEVVRERQLRDRYREILQKEIVDLTIERLATCAAEYQKLWQENPQTHHGELARQSYQRAQELLRGADLPDGGAKN